ncbi:MAG: hypothetical protein HUU37_08145 [Bdellovibrionales bacterium]|nr:hypothetical protein [Bdellovibrionales bacterium]
MGNELFDQVAALTGLPIEMIGPELKSLLDRKGVAPENLTMDSLREALEEYLREINAEMKAADETLV